MDMNAAALAFIVQEVGRLFAEPVIKSREHPPTQKKYIYIYKLQYRLVEGGEN